MAPKRKAASKANGEPPSKKPEPSISPAPQKEEQDTKGDQNRTTTVNFDHSRVEEQYGIVQREFYPPEMSNERCERYNNNEIPRPIEILEQTIADTAEARAKIKPGEAVVHWFKRDLRTHDNKGLSLAGQLAKKYNIPLIAMFIVSPQDYQAHFTSPPRVDFELRTLEVLKRDLGEKDIPLFVETIENRKRVPARLLELFEKWGAKHVFCNIEYEVDELRREAKMTKKCLDRGIDFTAVHDDVVVAPGQLHTQQGKQFSVYSPWSRAWTAHLHANPDMLDAFEAPGQNPPTAREKFKDIFDMSIPSAPANKKITEEERKRFAHLWPAGEHEALERLERFLNQKIGVYKSTRNFPAANSTAMLSVHHSAGTLAARTAVRSARDVNSTKKLDGGNEGVKGWISEVAWRDFYKHVLSHWPYVCMHKPFK